MSCRRPRSVRARPVGVKPSSNRPGAGTAVVSWRDVGERVPPVRLAEEGDLRDLGVLRLGQPKPVDSRRHVGSLAQDIGVTTGAGGAQIATNEDAAGDAD